MDSAQMQAYLLEARNSAAPLNCFKQTPTHLMTEARNVFEINWKLEARDPRNPASSCVATVIECQGPRLRLRLDGSDDRNDFWRLIDSEDICAYPSGALLVPPLGFEKSSSYWPGFLEKLKTSSNFVPPHCFKSVPNSPPRNLFFEGQRLEAVDRKNPQLICPATVGNIKADRLHVTFDGWRGAFDYWCRYDCRDLFPVGWCQAVGHQLQLPGHKEVTYLHSPLSSALQIKKPRRSVNCDLKTQSLDEMNESPRQQLIKCLDNEHTTTIITDSNALTVVESINGSASSSERAIKSSTLPTSLLHVLTETGVTPEEVSSAVARTPSDGFAQTQPLLRLWLYRTSDLFSCVFFRLEHLPEKFGPAPPAELLQQIQQAFLDAATTAGDPRPVWLRIDNGDGEFSVRANFGGRMHAKLLPFLEPSYAGVEKFWRLLREFLQRLDLVDLYRPSQPYICNQTGTHLYGSESTVSNELFSYATCESRKRPHCTNIQLKWTDSMLETSADSFHINKASFSDVRKILRKPLSEDVSKWSVSEVERFVRNADPSMIQLADKFQEHEIDGYALLLLTSDMMVKYMGLKLGPSIKLAAIVNQLLRGKEMQKQ